MNQIEHDQLLERPLPNSAESERAILGAIVLDNCLINQAIELLKPEDFYIPSHRRVFLAMIAPFERGSEINPILIGEELRRGGALESVGGITFITDLTYGLPYHGNITHYARVVQDRSLLRHLIKTTYKIASEAMEAEDEGATIYNQALLEIHALRDRFSDLCIEEAKSDALKLPELCSAAMHGLAGDFVRLIEPHTEADPAALLVQFLGAFGNCVGRSPHFTVEADDHYGNIFVVIVGATASGRKGTSWGHVRRCFDAVDEDWSRNRVANGMSSGEGLIDAVRDSDQAALDKRLLVQESEFARVLRAQGREGNTLSEVVRQAWDTGHLRSLVKNNPMRATDAHISIIGHITSEELQRRLGDVERFNGYVNRFLWVFSRRSKFLPEGGQAHKENYASLIHRLTSAISFARRCGEMRRDEGARALWHQTYQDLTTRPSGLFGAVTARAAPQVVRLSLIYALLDESETVQRVHLEAALALWKYSEESVRYVFGERTGDRIADEILRALRASNDHGLTRTDINSIFGGHRKRDEIDRALTILLESGLAKQESEATRGRSVQRWLATYCPAEEAEKAEEGNHEEAFSASSASSAAFRIVSEVYLPPKGDEIIETRGGQH